MTFQLYHSAKALSGLYGNKLAQVWDFTHHFFVSCFRLEVNTIIDRMFFGVRYKKGIQSMRAFEYWQLYLYLNSLLITGWYIYLLKSQQSTQRKFVVLIIFYVRMLDPCPSKGPVKSSLSVRLCISPSVIVIDVSPPILEVEITLNHRAWLNVFATWSVVNVPNSRFIWSFCQQKIEIIYFLFNLSTK